MAKFLVGIALIILGFKMLYNAVQGLQLVILNTFAISNGDSIVVGLIFLVVGIIAVITSG